MKVDESHLNPGGTLHGGLTATLVDSISTLAIMSAESHPGVSVDMNISYVAIYSEASSLSRPLKSGSPCIQIIQLTPLSKGL